MGGFSNRTMKLVRPITGQRYIHYRKLEINGKISPIVCRVVNDRKEDTEVETVQRRWIQCV